MKKRISAFTISVTAIVSIAAMGVGAALASAAAPPSDNAVVATSAPYAVNDNANTYGTAADANTPAEEPDLILVVATNNREGYVYRTDLEAADGTAAMATIRSPEEALAWQQTEGQLDHSITVYAADGRTVVGEFVIFGQASVNQQIEDAGVTETTP